MARRTLKSEPVLRDWAAVDGALKDIRELQHTLAELQIEKARKMDAITEEYSERSAPLEKKVKSIGKDVKEFVDAHRLDMEGKSRRLHFGSVGYRAGSKLVLSNEKVKDAIATLKALGFASCIEIKETLKRDEVKKQPQAVLDQIGAYIKTTDEFYYDISDRAVDE